MAKMKTPTKLGMAVATFDGLSITELEALKSMATAQIRMLAAESQECHFLKLSPELRNEIYSIVSTDLIRTICLGKKTTNGLAFANKQISQEYLSIRAGKVISAKYLKTLDPPEWRDIDAFEVLWYGNPHNKWASWCTPITIDALSLSHRSGREDALVDECRSRGQYPCWRHEIKSILKQCVKRYDGLITFNDGEECKVSFTLKDWYVAGLDNGMKFPGYVRQCRSEE